MSAEANRAAALFASAVGSPSGDPMSIALRAATRIPPENVPSPWPAPRVEIGISGLQFSAQNQRAITA